MGAGGWTLPGAGHSLVRRPGCKHRPVSAPGNLALPWQVQKANLRAKAQHLGGPAALVAQPRLVLFLLLMMDDLDSLSPPFQQGFSLPGSS